MRTLSSLFYIVKFMPTIYTIHYQSIGNFFQKICPILGHLFSIKDSFSIISNLIIAISVSKKIRILELAWFYTISTLYSLNE